MVNWQQKPKALGAVFSEDLFMCFTDPSGTEYHKLCDLYDKNMKFKDKD